MKKVYLIILCLIFSLIEILATAQEGFPQNFFTPVNNPNNAFVSGMTAFSDNKIFLAKSRDVFMSTDFGLNWNRIKLFDYGNLLCIAQKNSGILFAGLSSAGIWWTMDNGAAWNHNSIFVNPGTGTEASVEAIGIDNNGVVYASTALTGHYKSFNNGQNWSQFTIQSLGGFEKVFQYAFTGSNHIFIATTVGVFRSTDDGNFWTQMNNGIGEVITTGIVYHSQNELFIGTQNGVFKTADNGESWTPVNNGITSTDIKTMYLKNGILYAGTNDGKIFKSSNHGMNWNETKTVTNGEPVVAIYASGNNIIAGSNGGGVNRSTNGGDDWESANNGLPVEFMKKVIFYENSKMVVSTFTGIYFTNNSGQNWQKRINGLPVNATTIKSIERTPEGTLFALTANQGLYKTSNEGISWTPSTNGINFSDRLDFIHTAANERAWVSATDFTVSPPITKIYFSSNAGESWILKYQKNSTLTNWFTGSKSGDLYMSAPTFPAILTDSVFKSTDNGSVWQKISIDGNVFNKKKLFTVNNNTGDLYVISGTQNFLYRSTNGGLNWVQLNISWDQNAVLNCISFNSENKIFIGTSKKGVYVSSNQGADWQQWTSGLYSYGTPVNYAEITSMSPDQNNFMYLTTSEDGIYRTSNPANVIHTPGIAGNYFLSQNYPNPFNPITNIGFRITAQGFVALKVYNITGKHVATLINQPLSAGEYKVSWNAENFSSGVYFYKLEAYNFSEIKRMLLLK